MAWRLAQSLVVLRNEVNAAAPNRSKASDGTIGDDAHASGASDHNPNSAGVVCAIDFTHDPGNGADMHRISRAIVKRRPRALKYVIWNRQIWSVARASEGWRPYGGSNPHTKHMHVSAGVGSDGHSAGPYDDTSPWGVAAAVDPTPGFPDPTLREDDSGPEVEQLQRALNHALGLRLAADGDYGPATTTAVREHQRRAGLNPDGIYGSASAAALRDLLEDDMDLTDKLPVTQFTTDTWGRSTLDVQTALSHGYVYSRTASDKAVAIRAEQATHTALLKQLLAAQSGLSEAQITAAVAQGVRQAMPSVEELAGAVAAAVDHDLDTAAVEEALRNVLGGVDETTGAGA
jgi:hypothetical protein